MTGRYWLETLGCPKNQVDSEKLAGMLEAEGYVRAPQPGRADLVVVNTCAFIEPARQESVGTILELAESRKAGAKLVVTGCLAERYGQELADALPEVDQVAGFGAMFFQPGTAMEAPVRLLASRDAVPSFDLLNLPRRPASAPWAYVKVAEGCDRRCGFCAIPSFRGPQRSRSREAILGEVEALGAQEVVLVAQDLVSWGRDASREGPGGRLVELLRDVRAMVERVRLLYLYPSGLNEELIEAIGESGCPYFDLSLQHASRPLLRRMRRFGDGDLFLERIAGIRRRYPEAALRSSFIIGYPGETEEDHDRLLEFLQEAHLDWAGFFPFSNEQGTHAAGLAGHVPSWLVAERARECSEVQGSVTGGRRRQLVGTRCRALVDTPGQARSHREAPEIDGIISVPRSLAVGTWAHLEITDAVGPDLVARTVAADR
ncbi:MAG TPA: 30S ribosomal protein S12 methylthiotransferase RimO [Acidimicrobiales bacterium]|nr:30S ribosomal protein S12 methylthiotransferase RimO [Acidimicrobiales bacterium]